MGWPFFSSTIQKSCYVIIIKLLIIRLGILYEFDIENLLGSYDVCDDKASLLTLREGGPNPINKLMLPGMYGNIGTYV